jgi:hypothetical protein
MKWLEIIRVFKRKNLKAKFMNCLFISILILISSCQTKEEIIAKKLVGNWAIYEFEFKNKDCKEDLLINAMSFQEDKKFLIPEIFNHPAEDEEDDTKWEVQIDSTRNVKLIMNCKNPIFNNSYQVKFFKNYEIKGLGIELRSNTTRIVAYKSLQSFDINGEDWEK